MKLIQKYANTKEEARGQKHFKLFILFFILQVSFSAQRLFTSLNPSECPVTIVGKLANLKKIQYADIANRFAPIDEKVHIIFYIL